MVQLILLTGDFLILRQLLRVNGIALILLVNPEIKVCLILELELWDNLIAEAHITIYTITAIILVVHVAAPVWVVVELDSSIINTTNVP